MGKAKKSATGNVVKLTLDEMRNRGALTINGKLSHKANARVSLDGNVVTIQVLVDPDQVHTVLSSTGKSILFSASPIRVPELGLKGTVNLYFPIAGR